MMSLIPKTFLPFGQALGWVQQPMQRRRLLHPLSQHGALLCQQHVEWALLQDETNQIRRSFALEIAVR